MVYTRVAKIYYDEQNIVHIEFNFKGILINEQDSWEMFKARQELETLYKKQLLLVDIRSNPRPSREARDFARSSEMLSITGGMALIIGDPLSKLLGNFFLGFNKGDFPTKLFTNKVDASNWLLSLQKQ